MALLPGKSSDNTFFEIDRPKAHRKQVKFFQEWEPSKEVWALNYGNYAIAISAGLSGLIINSMFRKKLQLRHQAYGSSIFYSFVGPAAFAHICHNMYITRKILLYESQCPMCLGMKAATTLNFNGLLYPLLTIPAFNIAMAGQMGYQVPHIMEIKEVVKLWWSIVRPNAKVLGYVALMNILIAFMLTYKQIETMKTVEEILLQVQNFYKNNDVLSNKKLKI